MVFEDARGTIGGSFYRHVAVSMCWSLFHARLQMNLVLARARRSSLYMHCCLCAWIDVSCGSRLCLMWPLTWRLITHRERGAIEKFPQIRIGWPLVCGHYNSLSLHKLAYPPRAPHIVTSLRR